MPAKDIHITYLKMAEVYSQLSHANRKKVGAILVKDGRIVSTGYNGMPKGMDNTCEDTLQTREFPWSSLPEPLLKTKHEVIHAEMNAILFAARNGIPTEGCTLYLTLSPCVNCGKSIIQSGIKTVFFSDRYRDQSGVKFLENNGIKVIQQKIY